MHIPEEIRNRFGDAIDLFEVGEGAGDAEDFVVGAGAEAEAVDGGPYRNGKANSRATASCANATAFSLCPAARE